MHLCVLFVLCIISHLKFDLPDQHLKDGSGCSGFEDKNVVYSTTMKNRTSFLVKYALMFCGLKHPPNIPETLL